MLTLPDSPYLSDQAVRTSNLEKQPTHDSSDGDRRYQLKNSTQVIQTIPTCDEIASCLTYFTNGLTSLTHLAFLPERTTRGTTQVLAS